MSKGGERGRGSPQRRLMAAAALLGVLLVVGVLTAHGPDLRRPPRLSYGSASGGVRSLALRTRDAVRAHDAASEDGVLVRSQRNPAGRAGLEELVLPRVAGLDEPYVGVFGIRDETYWLRLEECARLDLRREDGEWRVAVPQDPVVAPTTTVTHAADDPDRPASTTTMPGTPTSSDCVGDLTSYPSPRG